MNKSESIAAIAAALAKAQAEGNAQDESVALKAFADIHSPSRKVNGLTAGTPVERFFNKVVFGASDCWTWRGHVSRLGYGAFSLGMEKKAHRVSYALHNGPIPDGLNVLHKCDNRQCVNPDHLFLGTQKDNVLDMCIKGRHRSVPLHGERNPMSVLTWDKVRQIRDAVASGATQRSMCSFYGVSPMTVSRIIRRETWI